jgi:DNA-directed RNA polymerase beta subunit
MITQNGTFIIAGVEKTIIIDGLTNRSLDQSPIDKGIDNLKSVAINRMSRISLETVTPARLIDTRSLGTAITEFFVGSREVRQ